MGEAPVRPPLQSTHPHLIHMPRKNWTPVVLDLITLLTQKGGAQLLSVDDGGETTHLVSPVTSTQLTEAENLAAEAITAVDSSTLRIMLGSETADIEIVLGNEPAEIVSDWSAPAWSRIHWMLEAITRKFSDQWEGKPCPLTEDDPVSDGAYRAAAQRLHMEGTLGITDYKEVIPERDKSGAYVVAWAWIPNADVTAEERA